MAGNVFKSGWNRIVQWVENAEVNQFEHNSALLSKRYGGSLFEFWMVSTGIEIFY